MDFWKIWLTKPKVSAWTQTIRGTWKNVFLTTFGATLDVLKKIRRSLSCVSVCDCFVPFCVCVCARMGWGVITASRWLRRSPVCPVGHLWVAWWALWNGALFAELNRHSHELQQTPWAQVASSLWGSVHTHICLHTTTWKRKMTLIHKHKAPSVVTTGDILTSF